jgi:hypothetical protein
MAARRAAPKKKKRAQAVSAKPGNKNGRPIGSFKKFDEKFLFNLGRIHCTDAEIEILTGCDRNTLERHKATIDRGRADGKMSLRRKQINTALAGNPTMLIWTGKQYLNQADHVNASHSVEFVTPEGLRSARERVEQLRPALTQSIVSTQDGNGVAYPTPRTNGNGSSHA